MKAAHRQTGGSIKDVISVAVPMVVSLSCDTVMTFTDRWFVSSLGSNAMNAVFLGGIAAFGAQTFFAGLIGYSTAMVAQQYGKGHSSRCVASTYQALHVALAAWPFLLLFIFAAHAAFPRLGVPVAQLSEQTRYFDILMLGSGLGLLRGAFSSFFSGLGRTRYVMFASLLSMSTNVFLVWVLVFGHFGLPALGVAGAAIGTLCASAMGVIVLATAFFSSRGARTLGPLPPFRINKGLLLELLRKGTPSGLEFFLNMLAFQALVVLFQRQGNVSATAATIMFNWDMVSFVPLVGIEIGVTSLVGRYFGARDFVALERSVRSGLRLGWLFSAVVFCAFVAMPGVLADMFAGNSPGHAFLQARPLAIDMLRIATIYVCIEAALLVYSGALRGIGDTLYTMVASNGLHFLLVGALYVTLEVFHCSTLTGWLIIVCLSTLFPVALGLRFHRKCSKNRELSHFSQAQHQSEVVA